MISLCPVSVKRRIILFHVTKDFLIDFAIVLLAIVVVFLKKNKKIVVPMKKK